MIEPGPNTDDVLDQMMNMIGPEKIRALSTAAAVSILATVKIYPPAPPHSKYRRGLDPRSENLGGSWTVAEVGDSDSIIGTRVSYAPYVKDQGRQTAVMKNIGWATIQDDVEAAKPEVMLLVSRQLMAWLGM